MDSDIVIQTNRLSKSFGKVHALQNLDLTVRKHSVCGFLGPNGAGKTTTIKMLLGLVHPSSGSASVFGMDSQNDSVQIRTRVGYLSQDPHYYEHMTAREVMRFTAGFFFKGPKEQIEQRVSECLGLVGLEGKSDRPIKGFSGGERQRLGIAQAQVNYPDLLILDEPAASLDPIGRRDVLEVIERLRKHTTVFYSTHILDDVQRVSDTVVILNQGKLVAEGPVEELLAGGEGCVFAIKLTGDTAPAVEQLQAQPWVKHIHQTSHAAETHLQVTVSDEGTAQRELLRLLVNSPVIVTEFRRKQYALEDIFMQVVQGGQP